ncbi:S8 family serine peptidase, partial [Actinoplanes sp. NPDC005259]|uniref:S8 family serine peptidase n=1 Tax=Actinoplanes sp. NPDC005259 TaxID=3154674 RepID=UPI0033B321CD
MQLRRVMVAAAVSAAVLLPAAPARAAPCRNPPGAAQVSKARPYEERMFAPGRLAPFATGDGVRVAVIDSGVDAGHPQLRDRVAAGRDFLHGEPDGRQDCVGHGTAVASIIAATPAEGAGPRGLAPGATIVPIRVSEQTDTDGGGQSGGEPADPGRFADAIDWAVGPGDADVINMSLVMADDDGRVRDAVARAVAAGVVVVAAAGNHGRADEANPRPYPASYPDVIGVGAIGANGVAGDFSQRGDWVDVTAPGVQVTFAARGSGHARGDGTSYATPFVSATAAFHRSRHDLVRPADAGRQRQHDRARVPPDPRPR